MLGCWRLVLIVVAMVTGRAPRVRGASYRVPRPGRCMLARCRGGTAGTTVWASRQVLPQYRRLFRYDSASRIIQRRGRMTTVVASPRQALHLARHPTRPGIDV